MSEQNAYIWRDTTDKNNFHIGEKQSNGCYYLWFTIFTDGINDLFGGETVTELNKISEESVPGTPIPIELTIKIKE